MPRKFQPTISHKNTIKFSDVPNPVHDVLSWMYLEQLEEIVRDFRHTHKIIYVVTDDSTPSCLVPVRDKEKRFLTIITLVK